MIRVGIIGAAGYTGGELIRLLINHPEAKIVFAKSESNAGKNIAEIHSSLIGEIEMCFSDKVDYETVDVLFLCLGHGRSRIFLEENKIPERIKIIDLSQDFRLKSSKHDFVYGLPEIHNNEIKSSRHIANPGCFATAIQLGLLPLAKAGLLRGDVSVNAITGSTGAGQSLSESTHFSWRDNNLSVYKVLTHQHIHEIRQTICEIQENYDADIDFIPYRGNFSRGIFCTELVKFSGIEGSAENPNIEQLEKIYKAFYANAPFTHYSEHPIDMKQVVNSNKALVHIEKIGRKAVVSVAIDNLLKGAVGQAVQNMNLMFGLDEQSGLRLKSSAF